jgi:glycine/D-amino acid oxidase-like deaminating enzyme
VIIGGGIVGVFAAYYLARSGLRVAVVEKGLIGAEQSSRNWGWCRQQNRDGRELPIATKSLDLWERFAADSGEDAGFRRCGLFYLSNDEQEIAGWARWHDFARTVGITTHMLDSAAATERGRATRRTWEGGVFSPTDGIADPANAAPAVARAIMKLGSTVHQSCAARGLETAGGRVSGVVTEKGVIRTDTAILAGGAWASSFCRQLGVRSAGLRSFLDPGGLRRHRRVARCLAYQRRIRHAAWRWRLYAGNQRSRPGRCDATTATVLIAIHSDVPQKTEEPFGGRARRPSFGS